MSEPTPDEIRTREMLREVQNLVPGVIEILQETLDMDRRSTDVSVLRNLYRAANWKRLMEMVRSFLGSHAWMTTARPDDEDEMLRFVGRHLSMKTEDGWITVFDDNGMLAKPALLPDVLDRIADRAQWLSKSFDRAVTSAIEHAEMTSPIEQFFLAEWKAQQVEFRSRLRLTPQHIVEVGQRRLRVDFFITGGTTDLLVELDGHEFHERTPEQAAHDRERERTLQLITGHRLLRFTGREVHQNVKQCLREVMAHAGVELAVH